MNEYYYYGLAAALNLTTALTFAAVRWFHTCQAPRERRQYIWPDRKLQCLVYLCAVVLLPYVVNPTDGAAWTLWKSYLPGCYYFYAGLLLLCFFGTVKQWSQWRAVSWMAALMVIAAMLPLLLGAWLPMGVLSADGMAVWQYVVVVESLVMMGYAGLAMYQVKHWLNEARDQNYSNPDDFPSDYARRVWLAPVLLTPLLWPAFIFDSPRLLAVQNVLLAVGNVVLLLNTMPAWRRAVILTGGDGDDEDDDADTNDRHDEQTAQRIAQTADEIDGYLVGQQAYLNPHLKIDDVVAHCSYGRSYVSQTFRQRYCSFAACVNRLRLQHFDRYTADHPELTKEAAANAAGFPSYNAYYRAKSRMEKDEKAADE